MQKLKHSFLAHSALAATVGAVAHGYGYPGLLTLTWGDEVHNVDRIKRARSAFKYFEILGAMGVVGMERHQSGRVHFHAGTVLPWSMPTPWAKLSQRFCGSVNGLDWQGLPVDEMGYALKYAIKEGNVWLLGWRPWHYHKVRNGPYVNGWLCKTSARYCVESMGRALYFGRVPAYCWEP